jgi:hypothetical protein
MVVGKVVAMRIDIATVSHLSLLSKRRCLDAESRGVRPVLVDRSVGVEVLLDEVRLGVGAISATMLNLFGPDAAGVVVN